MTINDIGLADLALTYFGKSDAVTAVALVWPESGANPDAIGPRDSKGDVPVGLWQVKAALHGYTIDQLKDPQTNAKAAADVKHAEGWHAWAVYNSGAYRMYLTRAQRAVSAALKANPNGPWIMEEKPTWKGPDWLNPVLEPLTAAANGIKFITDPGNWLRLAQFVAGGFVILLGVLFLLGGNKPVRKAVSLVPQGKAVTKVARSVAA